MISPTPLSARTPLFARTTLSVRTSLSVRTRLLARIDFDGAAEVVEFRPTGPRFRFLICTVEVDPRGSGVGRAQS